MRLEQAAQLPVSWLGERVPLAFQRQRLCQRDGDFTFGRAGTPVGAQGRRGFRRLFLFAVILAQACEGDAAQQLRVQQLRQPALQQRCDGMQVLAQRAHPVHAAPERTRQRPKA